MTTPGNTQALTAAFTFGILVNMASAGLVLYLKGHGSAIFRDGLRLALIVFLISSALWAQVEFISTVIDTTATSACQATVVLSSLLDQLARVSIEQYLLWAGGRNGLKSMSVLLPQVLLAVRFIAGVVFVGETRVQFKPTCVPVSNTVPLAVAVVALDAVILVVLAVQAILTKPKKDDINGQTQVSFNNNAILLIITGLAIWMGTSVTLLLGLGTIDLLFRTTIPATGLTILVGLVVVFSGTLVFPRERQPRLPESPTRRELNLDQDLSTADSRDYPPSRYEDLKEINRKSVSVFAARDVSVRKDPMTENSHGLPKISRPVTGVTGVGGFPIQGQLFPPMRPIEESTTSPPQPKGEKKVEISKSKKTIFDRGKGPASNITVGRLAISHPIVADSLDMQSALKRIPTTDLFTAAQNEKVRRAVPRSSAFIAKRSAPRTPTMSPDDAVKRAASTEGEGKASTLVLPEPLRSNSIKTTQTAGSVSINGHGSSTSAQLSQGSDDLRRRSPRQPESVPTKTPTFEPITHGRPIRIPIPRPQPPPEPLQVKTPEPLKTPLQQRPTIGLPNNPRAQLMRATNQDNGNQRQQTVMFINNIVYDDPHTVNDIIQGATMTLSSPPMSPTSVVNRPRPIPRRSDKDCQLYPSEFSPNHPGYRRSKSSGSIVNRKSILQSLPGTPTQLPPLPPPPMSAGNALRPFLHGTKSMTFDEKMTLLYPLSASSATTKFKRRSSVPDMPTLPIPLLEDSSMEDSLEASSNMNGDRRRQSSKTAGTDRSSVRSQDILAIDQSGQVELQPTTCQQSYEETRRRSSQIIPHGRFSDMFGVSDQKTRDEQATTNWGSVHSPVAPVEINASRLNARSTYIQKESRNYGRPPVPSSLGGFGEEVMTVMLDTSSQHSMSNLSNSNRLSFTTGDEESESSPELPKSEKHNSDGFHRRVGDYCPTFSATKEKMRSRKKPPPRPLLLNAPSNKKIVLTQAPEPSPLESPGVAYKMIQVQLQKFEQINRDSVESESKRLALLEGLELEMDQQENKWQTMQNNLSRDSMSSMQTSPARDSRPASTVDGLSRPSSTWSSAADRRASRIARMTSGGTSKPTREDGSITPSLQSSDATRASFWQSRLAEAQSVYMENASDLVVKRNDLNFVSVAMASLDTPTPPGTDEAGSDKKSIFQTWSSNMFQAAPNVPKLWKSSRSVEHVSTGTLWAAPPKKSPDMFEFVQAPVKTIRPAIQRTSEPLVIGSVHLWQMPVIAKKQNKSGRLWRKNVPEQLHIPEPQKGLTRPVTQRPPRRNMRVTLLPDILESPKPLPEKRGTLGIFQFPWGEKSESATIQPRPSHMYMAMPGTMTSSGPNNSVSLEARARQVEATEYSSSFFDDYDEEEGDDFSGSEGDDFDETTLWEIASLLQTEQSGIPSKHSLLPGPINSSALQDYIDDMPSEDEFGDDGADGFDVVPEDPVPDDPVPLTPSSSTIPQASLERSTLWVTNDLTEEPSGSNGLPQPDEEKWGRYIHDGTKRGRSQLRTEENAPLESADLWISRMERPIDASSHLWAAPLSDTSIHSVEEAPKQDLVIAVNESSALVQVSVEPTLLWEQPIVIDESSREGLFYVRVDHRRTSQPPAAIYMKRSPRTSRAPLDPIKTQDLWKPKLSSANERSNNDLLLWSNPLTLATDIPSLFKVDPERKHYRTTSAYPAALSMVSKSRLIPQPLSRLQSTRLWAVGISHVELDWMTMSTIRPLSPSIASVSSASSSARSSITDAASIMTNTTKASTVAESTRSGISLFQWATKKAEPEKSQLPNVPEDEDADMKKVDETPENSAAKSLVEDSTSLEMATIPPTRRQYRPTFAYQEDWDVALQGAIKAGHIVPMISRRTASPGEWSAALFSAITASYPKLDQVSRGQTLPLHWEDELQLAIARSRRINYDVSRRHPVFAGSSLVTKSAVIHPAATGLTHNVSVRHPVFFGSMITTTEDVHPAMSGATPPPPTVLER